MIRAVIVDDEVGGRKLLNDMLNLFCKDVSVEAEVQIIQKHKPDVVFLDINMPYGSGFDLLKAFPDRDFEVIFTTADQEFAIKAIKEEAKDFLVKPIDVDDLEKAIDRIRKIKEKESKAGCINSKIEIPINGSIRFVDPSSIIRVEGGGLF